MGKPFSEVFPTLKLNRQLSDLFGQSGVDKVTATRQKDKICIYINSDYLIQKADVFTVEKEIKKQLFPDYKMQIKIFEKFQLSVQYNTEKLMDAYRDSILLELGEYSHLMSNMFKKTEITYPSESVMHLCMEESVLVKEKTGELIRILEKIFNERCGIKTGVEVSYKEAAKSNHNDETDTLIQRQVAEIAARAGVTEEADSREDQSLQSKENGAAETTPDKTPSKAKTYSGKSGSEKGGYQRATKKSDNPNVIYGRDFEEESMDMEDIIGEIGEVVVRGKILVTDKREIKNDKTILIFDVTDFTDTMTIKMFVSNSQVNEITSEIKTGAFVKLKGVAMIDKFDGELTIGSIVGVKKLKDYTSSRMDYSARKRVELHCHTKMSDMDGVSEVKDLVKRAYQWGHSAIAVTDHGVVQSFPDANHVWEDLWRAEKNKRKEAGDTAPDKNDFFKVIYGMEAYLVDDLKGIVINSKQQDLQGTFVVFDLETTGFSPVKNKIIEIGAVKVVNGVITDRFSSFINPGVPIPFEIEKLTGINDEMVVTAEFVETVLPKFITFCENAVMVAHNASFDMGFLLENARRLDIKTDMTSLDTLGLSRVLLKEQSKHTLDAVAKTLHISLENHHRAVDDAEATAEIFLKFVQMLLEMGVEQVGQLNALTEDSKEAVSKMPSNHAIMLV